MSTYTEKLRDPRWQKKRLEIFNRDSFSCQMCNESKKELQVHHQYYVSGREPWDYPLWCYILICDNCHRNLHLSKKTLLYSFEMMLDLVVSKPTEINAFYLALDDAAAHEGRKRSPLRKKIISLLSCFLSKKSDEKADGQPAVLLKQKP